jgi:hypothetical protein
MLNFSLIWIFFVHHIHALAMVFSLSGKKFHLLYSSWKTPSIRMMAMSMLRTLVAGMCWVASAAKAAPSSKRALSTWNPDLGIPGRFYVDAVDFHFSLIVRSKQVVEILEGDPKSSIGLVNEKGVVCFTLFDRKHGEESFC